MGFLLPYVLLLDIILNKTHSSNRKKIVPFRLYLHQPKSPSTFYFMFTFNSRFLFKGILWERTHIEHKRTGHVYGVNLPVINTPNLLSYVQFEDLIADHRSYVTRLYVITIIIKSKREISFFISMNETPGWNRSTE